MQKRGMPETGARCVTTAATSFHACFTPLTTNSGIFTAANYTLLYYAHAVQDRRPDLPPRPLAWGALCREYAWLGAQLRMPAPSDLKTSLLLSKTSGSPFSSMKVSASRVQGWKGPSPPITLPRSRVFVARLVRVSHRRR